MGRANYEETGGMIDLDAKVTAAWLEGLVDEAKRLRKHVLDEYRSGAVSEAVAARLLDIDLWTLRYIGGTSRVAGAVAGAVAVSRCRPHRKWQQVLAIATSMANGSEKAPSARAIADHIGIKETSVRGHISRLKDVGKWPFEGDRKVDGRAGATPVPDRVLEAALALSNGTGKQPPARAIAEDVGITIEAVRQHIRNLRKAGRWTMRARIGRPPRSTHEAANGKA